MSILSTREWATLIWGLLFLVYIMCHNKEIRKSFWKVIVIFFDKKLRILWEIILLYVLAITIALELYSKYELLFLRMTFKEEKDKETKIRHRIAVLCTCRISVRRVLLFQREYMGRMYVRMKDEEFKNLIQEFRKACKRPTSQI